MSDNMVSFDIKKLNGLKKACREAKEETFIFEGNEYLVSYAKYLIEYLETRLKRE